MSRSSWLIHTGPTWHRSVPQTRGRGLHIETQIAQMIHRHRGEGCVKMEVEFEMMWPPAKECQCWKHPEAGRSKGWLLSWSLQREYGPADTWISARESWFWTSGRQRGEGIHWCSRMPANLFWCVTVFAGNKRPSFRSWNTTAFNWHVALSFPPFCPWVREGVSQTLCTMVSLWGCPLHFRMFWSIPTQLDASSTFPPVVITKNVSRHCQIPPGEPSNSLLRTTNLGLIPAISLQSCVFPSRFNNLSEPQFHYLYNNNIPTSQGGCEDIHMIEYTQSSQKSASYLGKCWINENHY